MGQALNVRRLAWLGIPTELPDDTIRFFRDVLGMRVEFEQDATTELSAENGDRVQVFGPGDAYFEFFRAHSSGPVALFEVADAEAARAELKTAGAEVVGDLEHDHAWTWIHVKGPDGNLYELASRRD